MTRTMNWSFLRRPFASLAYRDFRLVWSASMIHHLGEWMEMAGLLWFVQDLTGSAFLTSITMFLRVVPMVVLSIPAGIIADRVSRRNLMIASKGGTAALSVALALLTHLGLIEYWHILVISVLGSVATSINMPSRQAVIPNAVPRQHLMNAISLDSASMMSSRLIGAPLAGLLLASTGVTFIFGLRAISGIIATALLVRLPRFDPVRDGRRSSPVEDLKAGWQYLKRETVVFILVGMFFLPQLANLVQLTLLPVFTTEVLGVGAFEYGLLQMAPGVGAALSLVALASLTNMRRKGLFLIISALVMGLALMVFAGSRSFALSLAMLTIIGAMNNAFMTVDSTLVQSLTRDDMRGRVMGWREMVRGFSPIGSIMAGSVADLSSPPVGAAAVAVVSLLIPLFLFFLLPRVRRLE
ncbi:MAG: MFS transporter [Chloroflexi bacterium]|nr:MFS transporter [Chloroflexota bacterium]